MKSQKYIVFVLFVLTSFACTIKTQPEPENTRTPAIAENDTVTAPTLSLPALASATPVPARPSPPPATATLQATATATIEPTPDIFVVVPHPENPDYVFHVNTEVWDVLSRKPDYSVGNTEFLIHREIPSCSIGLIAPMGCESCVPPQPQIVYIGNANWEIQPFGGHVLLFHGKYEIGVDINTPFSTEEPNLAEACKQDAYDVLGSVSFANGAEISEAPLPTHTPDVSRMGWYPCGDNYPKSFLEPNSIAYVSVQDPRDQRIRAGAGTDQQVIGLVPPGTQLTVLGTDPQCVDGWVWWQVSVTDGDLTGWTAEGNGNEQWVQSEDYFNK